MKFFRSLDEKSSLPNLLILIKLREANLKGGGLVFVRVVERVELADELIRGFYDLGVASPNARPEMNLQLLQAQADLGLLYGYVAQHFSRIAC